MRAIGKKKLNPQKKELIWVSCLYLDMFLHKTSRIEVLEHLAKRGYSVTLFVARSRKEYVTKDSSIDIVQVPLRHLPLLSTIAFTGIVTLFLPYYILFKKPTHIVTDPNMTLLGFFGVSMLCRLKKIRLILDVRSTPVEVSGLTNRLQSFFFSVSILIAKKVFNGMTIITNQMKEDVCSKFAVDRSFPGVWTSGVCESLFNPKRFQERSARLRKTLGIKIDKFVVFYHGSFSQKRGLINCIKSMEQLQKQANKSKSKILLFLLGNGSSLSNLREEIAKNNLDNVIIHSPVDYAQVPEYIAMCDIAISALPDLPDWRHQSPLNVLEYLCMEKPVIATDILAHKEIMGNSKCAIYVPSAETNELAKAITRAYNNREKMASLGAYGKRIIEESYTWDKVAENFDKYLSIDNYPALTNSKVNKRLKLSALSAHHFDTAHPKKP
jgi:glycosyltransferase involved in cell wall biosynthesis